MHFPLGLGGYSGYSGVLGLKIPSTQFLTPKMDEPEKTFGNTFDRTKLKFSKTYLFFALGEACDVLLGVLGVLGLNILKKNL